MTKAHKYVVLGQGYTCGGKLAAVEVSELIVTELIKTKYNIFLTLNLSTWGFSQGAGDGAQWRGRMMEFSGGVGDGAQWRGRGWSSVEG